MPKGGHGRSGPAPTEGSRTSDRKGYSLTALPVAGFDGDAPDFPLPAATPREVEVWDQAWTTPQACAWIDEPWRWRSVAMWVRWSVRMEAGDASAALGNVVMRYADDIGMTASGLKLNGWKIADAPKAAVAAVESPAASVTDIRARFGSRGAS